MTKKGNSTCAIVCWALAALAAVFVFSVSREPTSFVAALLLAVAFAAFVGVVFTRLVCGIADRSGGHAALTAGAGASGTTTAGIADGITAPVGDSSTAGAIAARAARMAPVPNPPEPHVFESNVPHGTGPTPMTDAERAISAAGVSAVKRAAEELAARSPKVPRTPVKPTQTIGLDNGASNAGKIAERAARMAPKPNEHTPDILKSNVPAGDTPPSTVANADNPPAKFGHGIYVRDDTDADALAAKAAKDAKAKAASAAKAAEKKAAKAAEAKAAKAADAKAAKKAKADAAKKAAAAAAAPDYDGDGVREGTDEGKRPETLTAARGGKADDLKQIKGIGPKLEKLCNSLGFYHFDQIAAWSADEVAWVDANLQGFKGRVTRDTWVAQATVLAAGGETEFSKRVEDGDVY